MNVSHPVAIVDIFEPSSREGVVAVFQKSYMVVVFCIFCREGEYAEVRDFLKEFSVLLHSTSLEIKLSPIAHRIPCITPPVFLIIDGIWLIWTIDAYYLLPCGITLPLIELSLVSK